MSAPSNPPLQSNRLAQESSPYLLQHAHNPVDWYPWGAEAFEKARKENKPIFLSVGYSTCYWCHVMERQCFENHDIAAEMNRRCVNIKVDREERPDVDQLYMTAVQVLTRHGGWPMSVFLTADLRPFYGGTYFPPTDAHGRPGFVSIIRGIEEAFQKRPADVEKSAAQLVRILHQMAAPPPPREPILVDGAHVEGLIRRSISDYDARFGGFGGAPKFPRETLLELLLVHARSPMGDPEFKATVFQLVCNTLDALANGGIRDQLGGGFHRYSTDAQWLVPHFEIMLYDNAMLAFCYVEAFAQSGDVRYEAVARGIFDFILREMISPLGLFYTAIDAEVDSQEGHNYLWTRDEVVEILRVGYGDGAGQRTEIARFLTAYGFDGGPNFADPHIGNGVPDKNILFVAQAEKRDAKDGNPLSPLLDTELAKMRQFLLQARDKRKQPLLDTKVITSWNALMIRALAQGGKILGDSRYTDAAVRAAQALLREHRMSDGGLFRTSRDGASKYAGFLDDYAFLAQALLALGDSTGEAQWRQRADDLCSVMVDKFGDPENGGFYFSEQAATDLIIRQKTAVDSPLPSGNAVAAMALLELGNVSDCRKTIALFAQQVDSQGEGMSSMVQAIEQYLRKADPFTVSAGEEPPEQRPQSIEKLAGEIVSADAFWAGAGVVHVLLKIQRGYHINAHDLAPGLQLVKTNLTVVGDAAFEIIYPKAEELTTSFAEEPLAVYSGEITLVVKLSTAPSVAASKVTLHLEYQACNDNACLPPVRKEIVVKGA